MMRISQSVADGVLEDGSAGDKITRFPVITKEPNGCSAAGKLGFITIAIHHSQTSSGTFRALFTPETV